jgi:hypothetical protein
MSGDFDFDFDDDLLGDFDLESVEELPEEPTVTEYNGLTGFLFILLVGLARDASTFEPVVVVVTGRAGVTGVVGFTGTLPTELPFNSSRGTGLS